jgi:preprotein translocase subunit SecY
MNSGLKTLAKTTLGNLAQMTGIGNDTSLLIHIPGCVETALNTADCYFNGESLPFFYGILDVIICIILFIGFIWLLYFQEKEEQELNSTLGK